MEGGEAEQRGHVTCIGVLPSWWCNPGSSIPSWLLQQRQGGQGTDRDWRASHRLGGTGAGARGGGCRRRLGWLQPLHRPPESKHVGQSAAATIAPGQMACLLCRCSCRRRAWGWRPHGPPRARSWRQRWPPPWSGPAPRSSRRRSSGSGWPHHHLHSATPANYHHIVMLFQLICKQIEALGFQPGAPHGTWCCRQHAAIATAAAAQASAPYAGLKNISVSCLSLSKPSSASCHVGIKLSFSCQSAVRAAAAAAAGCVGLRCRSRQFDLAAHLLHSAFRYLVGGGRAGRNGASLGVAVWSGSGAAGRSRSCPRSHAAAWAPCTSPRRATPRAGRR